MTNKHLGARRSKYNNNDEFYTKLSTIESELSYYGNLFRNKIVYSNCDKSDSNFVKYFSNGTLGLKDFIHTSFDFRSEKSIKLLKHADLVVTNPPFSLFAEYRDHLIKHKKKFIVICSLMNLVDYKTLRHILPGFLYPGRTSETEFIKPDGSTASVSTRWIQNIQRHYNPPITLTQPKYYNVKNQWQRYLNYREAYNINRVNRISDFYASYPNYTGKIGVPISYIDKWNPDQFKLVGRIDFASVVPNKCLFARLIISTNKDARIWENAAERDFSRSYFHPNGVKALCRSFPTY